MVTLTAVIGCALLFALAALALPRRASCGGSCGTCASDCSRREEDAPRAR